MIIEKLSSMKGGWFVGNFEPTLIKTTDVEVAVKSYKSGDYESAHYHKIATEITVIVTGEVKMFGQIFEAGDIVIVEPGDVTDFTALKDSKCAVVKYPGANNDKYLVEGKND